MELGLPGCLAGKMTGMKYQTRLLYDLNDRRNQRQADLISLNEAERQILEEQDAAQNSMVKLDAILLVSKDVEKGLIPYAYLHKLDKAVADLLNETENSEQTLIDKVQTESLGLKYLRDLPLPSKTLWSISNGLQPADPIHSAIVSQKSVHSSIQDEKADIHKFLLSSI